MKPPEKQFAGIASGGTPTFGITSAAKALAIIFAPFRRLVYAVVKVSFSGLVDYQIQNVRQFHLLFYQYNEVSLIFIPKIFVN